MKSCRGSRSVSTILRSVDAPIPRIWRSSIIFRSTYPDIEIPEQSLPSFVLERASELADRPALIDDSNGRTLTYAQLDENMRRFAAGLQARGFGKGDVFAICLPNVPEFAVAFFGVGLAGGVITTANPLYTAHELAYQLNDSSARFLLTAPQFLEVALEAARESKVEEVFVLEGGKGATPFAELLENDPAAAVEPAIDPKKDLLVLPYSSGTTGKPKGVMLTHHNLVAIICQYRDLEEFDDHETLIAVLPFFHIYGMTVIMSAALSRGSTIVSLPRFNIDNFLGAIERHNVSIAYVVPPIVLALTNHPAVDSYDISSLKFINSGGAPMGADLEKACAARIGSVVKQGYGMTETSSVTHTNPYPGRIKTATCGLTVPHTECRIVDTDTGRNLGRNERGELWVRGPQIMKGYLNRPDATAECLDEDGWLRTGDIAIVDDDGYFRIVDRLKEFIKYKGYQVAPAELEDLLIAHEAIDDAAVVPSPDEEAGELPKGFIVLKTGVEIDAEEIMRYVAERVAPYKKLRLIEFVDEVPKSASVGRHAAPGAEELLPRSSLP
jgi:acyl-CoA synthetase (AMP-forming)/AMP-acid ligase II